MAVPETSLFELGEVETRQEQAYKPPTDSFYDHSRVEISAFLAPQEQEIVRRARAAHAIGYLNAGFIKPAAIDSNGFLVHEIDTARDYRPMVKYLAANPSDPEDVATATIMGPPEHGDYNSLPSLSLVSSHISDAGHELIKGYLKRGYDIKDISSLSGTKTRDSVRDILRRTIQEAHIARHEGRPEVWVFALVTGTHRALESSLTPDTFRRLGDDYSFGQSDLVTPDTELRPLIADPSRVIDNIYRNLRDAAVSEGDARLVRRLTDSLKFFTNGLPDQYLSQEVSAWRDGQSAQDIGRSALSG